MNDQSTFRLIPLITCTASNKTFNECHESGKQKEKGFQTDEQFYIDFARYYYSASKLPAYLVDNLINRCENDSNFIKNFSNIVLNSKIIENFKIKPQYQRSFLKTLINKLEKLSISIPDSIYNRLGVLMGSGDDEIVERVYIEDDCSKVFTFFRESSNQLSKGTTGLSVWQASCDLANLSLNLPLNNKVILELGAGCGVSGIAIAKKFPDSTVYLTDYDENVLNLLQQNVDLNNLNNAHVKTIDWCNFDESDWKQIEIDLIIAADVVYDTSLLPNLCNVIKWFLKRSNNALIACTLRNPDSLKCFENHLVNSSITTIEKVEYENETFSDGSIQLPQKTRFPFSSTIQTPTIFYNLAI